MSEFSGNKYHRGIKDICGRACFVFDKDRAEYVHAVIDHYCIVEALDVRRGPVEHAQKKLSFAGLREKGDLLQDLKEARDAITRAIQELEGQ